VLFTGRRNAGKQSWRWNGRTAQGRIVPAGTYAVRVAARNALGTVTLDRSVRVVRRGPR
jgi:flagellar hook assembly protein FlgD